MSLTISGPLVEIGVLNGNRWGISESEIEPLITGLRGIPLKICSGADAITNEHSCDYNHEPRAEIGQVIGAERVGNWIHTKAEVTDPEAIQKIASGTWTKHWSIFTGYASKDNDGMLRKVKPLAVTLVRNPAYPGAGYQADVSKISPAAPLGDFIKKVSKPALAAALEKLDREYPASGAKNLYPPAPTMPHISAPPAEENTKPSASSTKALEAVEEKLHNKFRGNTAPPSMTVDDALERLHKKFERTKNRPRKPEEQLNESQKGM